MTIARHYVTENGRAQRVLDRQAARRGLRRATREEIAAGSAAAPCGSCGEVPRVRWLGLEWIGEPWPRRIRLRSPVYVSRAPGCGCVAALKTLVSRLRERMKRPRPGEEEAGPTGA